MSGPLKLNVISHTPGVLSTSFTRKVAGQRASFVGSMPIAGFDECRKSRIDESPPLSRESFPIRPEQIAKLELHSDASSAANSSLKAADSIDDDGSARGDVLVGLALHLLPALAPKPGLIGGDRYDWAQLDPTIIVLDQLDLGVLPDRDGAGGEGQRVTRSSRETEPLAPASSCNAA